MLFESYRTMPLIDHVQLAPKKKAMALALINVNKFLVHCIGSN